MTIEIPFWLSDELAEEFLERCKEEGINIGVPVGPGKETGSTRYTVTAVGSSGRYDCIQVYERTKRAKARAQQIVANMKREFDAALDKEISYME